MGAKVRRPCQHLEQFPKSLIAIGRIGLDANRGRQRVLESGYVKPHRQVDVEGSRQDQLDVVAQALGVEMKCAVVARSACRLIQCDREPGIIICGRIPVGVEHRITAVDADGDRTGLEPKFQVGPQDPRTERQLRAAAVCGLIVVEEHFRSAAAEVDADIDGQIREGFQPDVAAAPQEIAERTYRVHGRQQRAQVQTEREQLRVQLLELHV